MCPTVRYYNSIGGYNSICEKLGYKVRFSGILKNIKLPKNTVLIQDTREQKPLQFHIPVEVKTLKVGDYAINGSNIVIERKSLSDFVSTISARKKIVVGNSKSGIERFRAELDRARALGAYIIMVVEEDINSALSFNYLPHMRHTSATPAFIFKNLRDILVDYADCFQVIFVKGRYEATQIIIKIFEAGESAKTTDLQYAYEEGFLCGLNLKML
jgi:ERCC4-type nuclease